MDGTDCADCVRALSEINGLCFEVREESWRLRSTGLSPPCEGLDMSSFHHGIVCGSGLIISTRDRKMSK